MANEVNVLDFENVNGVLLSLKVESREISPFSMRFTITYKGTEKKSIWHMITLSSAVVLYALILGYVRISVTALSVIIIVLSFLVFFWVTHSVQSESLHVIPTVGIQSTVKYVCGSENNFVPWSTIDDVIINEVIKLNRVLYFLTVIVKIRNPVNDAESMKLITMFKYTKPRLLMLEKIYNELQLLLEEVRPRQPHWAPGENG